MERPRDGEYPPFYARYVALVPETHRYAEGKWSVREVLGHIVDGERVFGYRAFCFSRGETAALCRFGSSSTSSRWCAGRTSSCCAAWSRRSGYVSAPRAAGQ